MIIITRVATGKVHSSPTQFFCSQESLDANEPLAGSAPRADVWFLLEYAGRWGNQALEESTIPEDVKRYLKAQLDGIPASRLLLIKQSNSPRPSIAFFAALPKSQPPVLYRFELAKYEDLLHVDLAGLAGGDPQFASALSQEAVFVTCTNGRRDQCCALHGEATYLALAHTFPGRVWRSTHQGGHRFAANVLHLPHAISYGRLRPEIAPSTLEACLDGRVSLANLRGRTIYPAAVQAAEVLLRQQLQLDDLNGLRLQDANEIKPNLWKVIFNKNGDRVEVHVQQEVSGQQLHISCGDEKTSPMVTYRLIEPKAA